MIDFSLLANFKKNFEFKFYISIRNPFCKGGCTKPFYSFDKKLTKFKRFSLDIGIGDAFHILAFDAQACNGNSDHAGYLLDIDILGFFMIFNIYDIRHWDYEKEEWQKI